MVLKRLMIAVFLAGALALNAAAGEVVVRIGPPHPVHENRGRAPGRDYVWINGYHRWDGNSYVWTSGRWEQPPRRHAHWEAHRWVHRHDGWVLVEGRWR